MARLPDSLLEDGYSIRSLGKSPGGFVMKVLLSSEAPKYQVLTVVRQLDERYRTVAYLQDVEQDKDRPNVYRHSDNTHHPISLEEANAHIERNNELILSAKSLGPVSVEQVITTASSV